MQSHFIDWNGLMLQWVQFRCRIPFCLKLALCNSNLVFQQTGSVCCGVSGGECVKHSGLKRSLIPPPCLGIQPPCSQLLVSAIFERPRLSYRRRSQLFMLLAITGGMTGGRACVSAASFWVCTLPVQEEIGCRLAYI